MPSKPTEDQVTALMVGTQCPHWRGYMLNDGIMLLVHKDHDVDITGDAAVFVDQSGNICAYPGASYAAS